MRSACLAVASLFILGSFTQVDGARREASRTDEQILLAANEGPFQRREARCENGQCKAAEPVATVRKFGTAVKWAASPGEAIRKAKSESKLVCVVHLSGNFEKQQFT